MVEANTSPCSRQAFPVLGARDPAVSCASGDGGSPAGAAPRPTGSCLSWLHDPELAVYTLHGPANVKLPRSDADVIPPQGEQLAAAKSSRQRQDIQRLQPLIVDYIEQALGLRETQAHAAVVSNRRCFHLHRNVPDDQLHTVGITQGIANQLVHVPQSGSARRGTARCLLGPCLGNNRRKLCTRQCLNDRLNCVEGRTQCTLEVVPPG